MKFRDPPDALPPPLPPPPLPPHLHCHTPHSAVHEWTQLRRAAANSGAPQSDRLHYGMADAQVQQWRRRRQHMLLHANVWVTLVASVALLLITPRVLGIELPSDVSPLTLCSTDRFERSYDSLVDPEKGLFEGWSDKEAVVKRYAELVKINSCERVPSTRWPTTLNLSKPLIINAGEGSTATRFLNCVMRRIGHYGAHTRGGPNKQKQNNTEFMGCEYYPSCTHGWDLFKYISDSPVAYQLTELLATHPNALVLHSLRDPASWKVSRIKKHLHQGAAQWHQAGPCGMVDHPMEHPKTELDFVVYNAWAKCVSPVGKRYLQINLFKQETVSVVLKILFFIHAHNLTIRPRVIGGMANISTYKHLAVALEDTCREEAFLASLRNGSDVKGSNFTVANNNRGKAGGITPSMTKKKDDGIADVIVRVKRDMCENAPKYTEYSQATDVVVQGDSCKMMMPTVGLGRGRNLIEDSYNDPTLDLEKCCQKCNSLPTCKGWSVNSNLKGCFLKKEVPDTKWWAYGTAANVASGVKSQQTLKVGTAAHAAWCNHLPEPEPHGQGAVVESVTVENAAKRSASAWSDVQYGLGLEKPP